MPGKPKKQYSLGRTEGHDLDLPSGATCLVIRPGPTGLIKAGLLDSLDSLTSLVQIEHIDTKDPKKMAAAAKGMMQDPKRLQEGMDLIDKVVCFVVQQPAVRMPPTEEEIKERAEKGLPPRDPKWFYIDDVDDEDKTFIFHYVMGGSKDLERFRQEREQLLGDIPISEDIPVPAQ